MIKEIRAVLRKYAGLSVDVDTVLPEADLYAAGLTSHGVVDMMVALEDAFSVEFPDRLLNRNSFQSIASIQEAVSNATPLT